MKVLICGDIHGNLPALEKVLEREKFNYDLLICHGDIVNYAPWSNECVDLLIATENCVLLSGNHEQSYLAGFYNGQNEVAKSFFEFCYPKFNRHDVIARFGNKYEIGQFKVVHTIDDLYVYPDSNIDLVMENHSHNYIIGHSHHQFKLVSNNGLQLYNTGSIGQNRKNLNEINYIIYDLSSGEVDLKVLLYDARVVINEMKTKKYPEICINYYLSKLEN